MSNIDNWTIFLEEVLPEFGIELEGENITKLATAILDNILASSSFEFDRLGGMKSLEPKPDYEILYRNTLRELNESKKENEIYRKNVARRWNTDERNVCIEDERVTIYR